jgi:Protein of unknown function (DUF4238)
MTIAKVQHYVPQFLLRNFGNGKKDQVWVYDKSSGRSFPSNARNIASESRFYDFEYQGHLLTLETWLSELEGKAKSVISSILDAYTLSALTKEQKNILASFLSVQLTRTKTFREEWNAFPRMIRKHFEKSGDQVGAPENYAAHFLDKDWVLAATTRKHPFLLSDNPLTRQNMIDRPNRGNLGLKTPGIEIYFPLSPTRALAMWCTTLTELVHRRALSIMARSKEPAAADGSDRDGIIAMSDSLLSGKPVHYSIANVENFNSLQVIWSERYVFSHANEFHLAQSMLGETPNLRKGPRSTVA